VTEVEEKVKQIQANILTAQSRQKSCADKRCHPLEFEVGDHIYLRVSPMKGVRGIKGKVSHHRQVWIIVLSSRATVKAIRGA
jgi:hypothetical protein